MTNEELLQKINDRLNECTTHDYAPANLAIALRKVVELHKPNEYGNCLGCPTHGEFACGLDNEWKHCPTIRAIEAELG